MKIKRKEQILKAAREKQQITHKGIPIRITADLSIETLQAGAQNRDSRIGARRRLLPAKIEDAEAPRWLPERLVRTAETISSKPDEEIDDSRA